MSTHEYPKEMIDPGEDANPEPPKFCRQCAGSEFDWWGIAAFKCKTCGDVAHWLSPERRQAISASLAALKALT